MEKISGKQFLPRLDLNKASNELFKTYLRENRVEGVLRRGIRFPKPFDAKLEKNSTCFL